GATFAMMGGAAQIPNEVQQVFSTYNTGSPRIAADIDRNKALMMGVQPSAVFDTLGVYLGSSYINVFNLLGRTFRVTAQAEPSSRDDIADIATLTTPSASGAMVPIGAVANLREYSGPARGRARLPAPGCRSAPPPTSARTPVPPATSATTCSRLPTLSVRPRRASRPARL